MIVIKIILLVLLFCSSTTIGLLIASKYNNRVKQLKEIKKGLNILETKIKFTAEPLPEVFHELGQSMEGIVGAIFQMASNKMNIQNATQSWEEALQENKTSLLKEDIDLLKGMGKLLGKTDLEGQISEIELTKTFLDTQIKRAEKECEKNEKLYKTLGLVGGTALVIILI